MAQRRLTLLARFDVPPERLWEVVIDHEGMSRWCGAEVRVIAGPGNGSSGTVRRVTAMGLKIDEEILWVEPPGSAAPGVGRYAYRIIRGLPVSYHQGEMTVRPWGDDGSELWWEITLDSNVPGVAAAITRALHPGLNRALKALGEQLQDQLQT